MRALLLAVGVAALAAACKASPQPAARSSVEAAAAAPAGPPPSTTALTSAKLDELLRAEWTKSGIAPVARASDATYLRRVYLDVVGTIPPPDVVTRFAADARPDKRALLVEGLLASPAYADHWAKYWSEVLIGHSLQEPLVDRVAFERWLSSRFAANAPWTDIVRELVAAQGVTGEGGPRYGGGGQAGGADAGAMTPMVAPDEPAAQGPGAPINGAVNLFVKYKDAPQDMAGTVSRVFLGVQIQCAQCHDHKTEKWKQEDFRGFASCFTHTRTEVLDRDKAMAGRKRADIVDIGRPLPRFLKNPELAVFTQAAPRALDGTDLSRAPDARQALAAWMTSPQNPWLAQAIVNRMWGHFLGRGFVNPVDDLRPSNPASAPELLAALSADFQATGYDLKRLVRLIAGTEAYQLASSARVGVDPAVAADQDRLWPRFRLEPLAPEELLNALMSATGVEETLRASGKFDVDRIRAVIFTAYSYLFDVDEEADQTNFEGTIAQALALLNGRLVGAGSADIPGSALDHIVSQPTGDREKIEALYLRTLSRPPTPAEADYFVRFVNAPHAPDVDPPPASAAPPGKASPEGPLARLRALKAQAKGGKKGTPNFLGPDAFDRLETHAARLTDPKLRAYEDVLWALLNSSEFTFNH